jgi:hypothetical protein
MAGRSQRTSRSLHEKDRSLESQDRGGGQEDGGVADNIWMDETDIMAALIEEVDTRREAEEPKKNEK